MAPARTPARPAPRAVAPPAPTRRGFMSLAFYSGGFTLPQGDYALTFAALNHQATNQQGAPMGATRLGIMATAYPINRQTGELAGEVQEQFYSMGSKANLSFTVDPDNDKRLVAIPGGPSSGLNNLTNWYAFLKSLHDSGLPENTCPDEMDISPLDGIWVHITHIPEPEGRKEMQAKTGEASMEPQEARKGPGIIPVVDEILEGGKPWEGTGGVPGESAAPAPAAKPAARPASARPAAARPAAPARAAAPAPPAAEADEDLAVTASNVVADILGREEFMNGLPRLRLRTETFKAANNNPAMGPEMAQSLLDTFFGTDDALNSVLGPLGYTVASGQVKVA